MDGSEHNSQRPVTRNPDGLATPGGHYSHVAIANGMVFVSGQLPIDAQGQKLTNASFEAQAEQVLANLKAALAGAGSSIEQLIQVRVYIVDIEHWATFNQIYAHGRTMPGRPAPSSRFPSFTSASRLKSRPSLYCRVWPVYGLRLVGDIGAGFRSTTARYVNPPCTGNQSTSAARR